MFRMVEAAVQRVCIYRHCTLWVVLCARAYVASQEKTKLLRMQLLQSSRLLDPEAAAAAIQAALGSEASSDGGGDGDGGSDGPSHRPTADGGTTSASGVDSAAARAVAARRRALFAAGRYGSSGARRYLAGEDGVPSPPANVTHVTFEPSSGVLAPGEEVTVRVTCHALTDGQHRSIIQLRSGSDGHMDCLEAFVCVVTPTCVIDEPVISLGVTFVGVPVGAGGRGQRLRAAVALCGRKH